MQKEGEQIPDFSTIFYDNKKKRIIKRTKKNVEIGGQLGMMITDKNLVHGTDADPWLTARAGVALTQTTKDNVDRLMIDLEKSRKNAAQLKDTLIKERDEGNKLNMKFEDTHNEMRTSKEEFQTLQARKLALEVLAEKNEWEAQNSLAQLQKLQLEYHGLKTENNDLKVSYETLST